MNRKGFIGIVLLTVALILIIIASTVLFDFFFVLFRTGHSEENMSTDYANLSSGIYYGIWLADHAGTFPKIISVNGVNVQVTYNAGPPPTITAGPVNGRSITVQYENSVIKSWS